MKNKFRFFFISLLFHSLYSNDIVILPFFDSLAALKFVKNYLPHDPIIVEAGAFDGKDTLLMTKLWPASTIYTFEPIPTSFKWLTVNTKDYKNIFRYMYALSDKNGVAKMYVSEDPNIPDVPTLSSSLLAPKEHLNYHHHIFKKTILVKTITLDKWAEINKISKIDMLWLDMQGYELNALKHATNILKTVKIIFTEAEFVEAYEGQPLYSELKEWLEDKGFKLIAKDIVEPSKKHWCCNLVFLAKE